VAASVAREAQVRSQSRRFAPAGSACEGRGTAGKPSRRDLVTALTNTRWQRARVFARGASPSCRSPGEWNAGFIRQGGGQPSPLPDESGVPVPWRDVAGTDNPRMRGFARRARACTRRGASYK